MSNNEISENLLALWENKKDNKLAKELNKQVATKNREILNSLDFIIRNEKENGFVLNLAVKAYIRIKRTCLNSLTPIYDIWDINEHTVQESILEVLGYDKVVPTVDEQKEIINKYFYFGDGLDLNFYGDPRYGLAAACAGWENDIVKAFLEYCLTINDAPIKYVAKKSLEGKYVKLR